VGPTVRFRRCPGIRADVEHWLRTLRHGGPRSRPRAPETAWTYLRTAAPALAAWSGRYDHLREVTREDILAAIGGLTGHERHHALSVIRSLFRHCKKNRTIFRDRQRLRVGEHPATSSFRCTMTTSTRPSRPPGIPGTGSSWRWPPSTPPGPRRAANQLDDISLGNRRLTIAGRTRPLADLARQMILGWLSYRRDRWPGTANPHLIINQQTAMKTGPVSKVWLTGPFRGQAATLDSITDHGTSSGSSRNSPR